MVIATGSLEECQQNIDDEQHSYSTATDHTQTNHPHQQEGFTQQAGTLKKNMSFAGFLYSFSSLLNIKRCNFHVWPLCEMTPD